MKISGALSALTLAVGMLVPSAAAATTSPGVNGSQSEEFHATIRPVDEATRAGMIGVSWKPGCPVPIDDLRIIEMNYVGFDGQVHDGGQLMVHRLVADDVVTAFRALFE